MHDRYYLYTPLAAVFLLISTAACGRFSQSNDSFLKRGEALLASGDVPRAILEFRNAVQRTPGDAEAHYQLGLAYLRAGDAQDGMAEFRRVVDWNPNHIKAQTKLAELLVASSDEAVLRDAIERLRSALTAVPDMVEASDALALAEWRLGKLDDAAKRLEEAFQKFPASLQTAVVLARLKMSQKDLAGAEAVLRKAAESSPQSPEAAVAAGELCLLLDQPESSERYFLQALERDAKNGPALLGLAAVQVAGRRLYEAEATLRRVSALPGREYRPQHAIFLYQTGKRQEALAEFESLAKSDPGDRAARSRLISAYFSMQKLAEAQKILADALKKNSQDVDALLQRSELYLRWGRPSEAEADLKEVLHFTPNSAQAHLVLAGVYRLQRMTNSERQELFEALRLDPALLPARLALARNVVELEPRTALQVIDDAPEAQRRILPLMVERNWALLAVGDMRAVRNELNHDLQLGRIPDLVLQDAVLRLKEGDYAGARTAAEEVLKRNAEDVRAARVITDSYVAQKQLAKAGERLQQIIAARPRSAALQHLLGQWWITTGNMVGARKAFEAAKAADVKFTAAEFALAEVDIREGLNDQAIARLRTLAVAEPKNVAVLLKLAGLEQASGRQDDAVARYRAVLDVDGGNVLALNNLAETIAATHPDQALQLAREALERDPDNPAVQDTLGWIYYRKRMYDMALVHLKAAVQTQPTPRRQFHLALSYFKTGDKIPGEKLLQKALQQDPNLSKTEQVW